MQALLDSLKARLVKLQQWEPGQPYEFSDFDINGEKPDFGTDIQQATEDTSTDNLIVNTEDDIAWEAYQRLGLKNRNAISNYEAAIKLLIEHGTLDTQDKFVITRIFKNHDILICQCNFLFHQYQPLSICRIRALQELQQIWLGDTKTGEIYESCGSLVTFGRLQNLSNGRALAVTYPHVSQWKSTATTCLELLYLVLYYKQEQGDFKIESAKYFIERRGNTLNFRNKQNMLLLEGDVIQLPSEYLEIKVNTSYLSIVDAEIISQEFKHTYNYDDMLEREIDTELARTLPNGESLAWGATHAVPISRIDIDRSWTVPLGELLPGNVDDEVTAMAVMEAAQFILKNNDGNKFIGENYYVINISSRDSMKAAIYNPSRSLMLKWQGISGVENHGITIEIAREIMMQAQSMQTEKCNQGPSTQIEAELCKA